MLDYNIQFLLSKEDEVRTKLAVKYDKNLDLYGKQNFNMGFYIETLYYLLKQDYFGNNLKLRIYQKLIDILRVMGFVYRTIEPPMPKAAYPYYHGAGAPALTPVDIQAMTSDLTIRGNKTYTFDCTNEVYYVAYPAYYGSLRSILDVNGFETINGWTRRSEVFTIDAVPVNYLVYEFNHITTQLGFSNTFKY